MAGSKWLWGSAGILSLLAHAGAAAILTMAPAPKDEEALIAGLGSGHIGFAALDVFASEPLSPDSPLWDMDNVIVSPHTAANSPHEERLIAELFTDNARRFLDGEPLRNVVNTREFY